MSFVLSKILWMFFSPGSIMIALLLVGGFLGMSHNEQWQRRGTRICFYVALLLFIVSIVPIGNWLIIPLENRFPPHKPDRVDGIVLLGGDERALFSEQRGQPVMLDSARRMIEFARLAREYPNAKLLYSGGSGLLTREGKMTEAEVAKEALKELGVPVDRMVFEDQSRNTHENAVLAAAAIHLTPNQNWLLVTSAYHMPRAMASFRHVGWTVYPMTTSYITGGFYSTKLDLSLAEHLAQMTVAIHEYYGLFAYWLAGYIDTPWPH